MTERIDRTERLLNLVIGLLGAVVPVTRAEIRRQIPGYRASASDGAFERMFERDKDELRSMGIPIETVHDASGEVLGYRIPQDDYALEPIDFTVEERAAIAVAAEAWRRAPIAPVPGTALRKLQSAGGSEWTPAGLRGPVELTHVDGALLPLMSALRAGSVVRFAYQPPDRDAPAQRTVSPWGLVSSSGRWFLIGHDHDRAAERTFRLSRMVGDVEPVDGDRVPAPAGFDAARARTATIGDAPRAVTVRVVPGRAAALRRRARAEAGADPLTAELLTVDVGSVEEAVALACGAAADVVVLDPPEVVAAVVETLRELAHAHGAGDGS